MPNALRRIPDELPSSAVLISAERDRGYFLNPASTVDVPVPPPIITIFVVIDFAISQYNAFVREAVTRRGTLQPFSLPSLSRVRQTELMQ